MTFYRSIHIFKKTYVKSPKGMEEFWVNCRILVLWFKRPGPEEAKKNPNVRQNQYSRHPHNPYSSVDGPELWVFRVYGVWEVS